MNYPLYFSYLAAISLLIATPGSVLAYVLNVGGRLGFCSALLAVSGTNLASLVLIAAAVSMLLGVWTVDPVWFHTLGLLGSVLLVAIAVRLLAAKETEPSNTRQVQETDHPISILRRGFLIAVANPKDIIFFSTFFAQFSGITPAIGRSMLILTITWIVCDVLILCTYVLLIRHRAVRRLLPAIARLSAWIILWVGVISGFFNIRNVLF